MRAQRLDHTEEGIAVEGNFSRTNRRFEAAYEEDAYKLLEEYAWVSRVWDKSLLGLIKEEDKCINSGDTVSLGPYLRWLKRINSHWRDIATSVVNPFDRIRFKPEEPI